MTPSASSSSKFIAVLFFAMCAAGVLIVTIPPPQPSHVQKSYPLLDLGGSISAEHQKKAMTQAEIMKIRLHEYTAFLPQLASQGPSRQAMQVLANADLYYRSFQKEAEVVTAMDEEIHAYSYPGNHVSPKARQLRAESKQYLEEISTFKKQVKEDYLKIRNLLTPLS